MQTLGQLSKDAQRSFSVARDALVEALDHMKLVVGDDGNDIEQITEAPWPLVSFRSSRFSFKPLKFPEQEQ
jgi:hypothetical protein